MKFSGGGNMFKPCSSYVEGSICLEGFPFSGVTACSGSVCHSCKKPDEKLPPCQDEDLLSYSLDDRGYPRLFNEDRKRRILESKLKKS